MVTSPDYFESSIAVPILGWMLGTAEWTLTFDEQDAEYRREHRCIIPDERAKPDDTGRQHGADKTKRSVFFEFSGEYGQ
jgi:hypothetical protein